VACFLLTQSKNGIGQPPDRLAVMTHPSGLMGCDFTDKVLLKHSNILFYTSYLMYLAINSGVFEFIFRIPPRKTAPSGAV
jgi:hypothetical protein